jgi:putative ABC transport system permease protein
MLRLGLRSVLAHRLRFVLCVVAVLLGVAFVAGSLIFTDTLSAALRKNFGGSTADVTVTPVSTLDNGGAPGTTNARPVTLSAELADRIAAVDGVAGTDAQLLVAGVQVLDRDGRPVDTYGLPTFGAAWPHDDRTAPFRLLEGKAPWGTQELALDRATARRAGYEQGDRVKVVTPTRTVSGVLTALVSPALTGASAGAPLVAFDPATAQQFLLGETGWTSIGVVLQPGTEPAAVVPAIQQVAGKDVQVRTAAQVAADGENALDDTFGGFSAVLLMFAALALFVATFLIVNTFSMLVAQRARELAMLRAIGASQSQVTRAVLVEALVIGLTGATLGLLAGAAVTAALQFSFEQLRLAIPSVSLQLHWRTVVVAYVVGIGVTLAAAYPAARRAGRLPPVAALRDHAGLGGRSQRVRLVIGGFLLLMAAVCYLTAQQARGLPGAVLLGLGAGITLLGVMLTGPLVSPYVVRLLTWPFGRRAPAVLGRRNAERDPRRTSATASALMISLALVSGLVVLAASAEASIDKGIADAIGTSELVVDGDGRPFSADVSKQVAATPGVASVHRVRSLRGEVGGTPVQVVGVDPGVLDGPIVTKVDAGSTETLANGQVVLPRNLARTLGVSVGGTLGLVTANGRHDLTVGAVVAPNRQLDAVVLFLPTFLRLGGGTTDSTLYVEVAEGAATGQVRAAVLARLGDHPSVQVRDQQAYAESQRGPVAVIRAVIGMLLLLAVVIAVLGVVNTLALGVVERTREIGLLRAVGMDRPQLRRMLQVEAIAISLLGAVLGLGVGVLFGSAVQSVMSEDGLAVLDLPVLQLLAVLLVSAVVGVLAAVLPARRASRLDVLAAIGAE